MTKGQRAMAVAKIYPEPEQGKRKTSLETKQVGISKTNLSFARTVLAYAPDLATNVLTGSSSLDEAYKTARERDAMMGRASPSSIPRPPRAISW